MRQKGSSLRRNVFSGMFFAVGNILILLISYPIYLKYLGMERYGLWAILSVVVNFSELARLGIDTAVIKYVAEEYGRNNIIGIRGYFSTAIITLLISSVLICCILIPLKGFIISILDIPKEYISIANTLLPYMIIFSILIYFVQTINGTLRGLGRVDLANYYFLGCKAIAIPIVVILFEFGYGLWGLFWSQLFIYIFLGFLSFFGIYRKLGNIFSVHSFNWKYFKKLLGFGGTMTASSLISMFMMPFNKVVIARYINLSGVTYFEIASKAIMQIRSIFDMGIKAIMPEISRLSVTFKEAKIKIYSVFKKAMQIVYYLGIPVFIFLFFLGPFLLKLWLAGQYMPEIGNAFRIVLVGCAMNLLSVPIYYSFMGIGKVRYCFIAHMVQSVLNVAIISIFITLGITNFYLFVGIYSLSISISAILLIVLFHIYRKVNFMKIYKISTR